MWGGMLYFSTVNLAPRWRRVQKVQAGRDGWGDMRLAAAEGVAHREGTVVSV